jgi:plastocyanin
MLTKSLLLLAAAAATIPLTTAAPAPQPTKTWTAPRTTHSVVAGRPGLRFDPENIVAEVGSIVEFHFLQLNHSVVESSFDSPCVPKDAASFFSGFFPVPRNPDGSASQSAEVFQIEVKDDKPIWFYCAQNTGRHCQSGMVGVVNQRFDSGKTLEVFRGAASKVPGQSGVQAQVQGGWRGPNPNPQGGF